MLLLVGNLVPNRSECRLTYGKRAVTRLPGKMLVFRPTPANPPRRIRFNQAGNVGYGVVGRHADQEMHMIAGSIHAKGGASNLTNDAAEVCVQVLFEIGLD